MNAAFQKAVDLAMWTSQVFILLFVLVDFISIITWLITVTTVVLFYYFYFFQNVIFLIKCYSYSTNAQQNHLKALHALS